MMKLRLSFVLTASILSLVGIAQSAHPSLPSGPTWAENSQTVSSASPIGSQLPVFFSEDFSNGLAGSNGIGPMTIEDAGGVNDPIWMMALPTSPSGDFSHPENLDVLTSTTASNGWVIFDADLWNSPVSDGVFEAWGFLNAPILDMSNRSSVVVEWEHSFRYCCEGFSPLTIEVSVDGGITYEAFSAQGAVPEEYNLESGTVTNSVDISSVADGQESVMIRWAFNSALAGHVWYYWQIDDIVISGDILDGLSEQFEIPGLGLGQNIPNPFSGDAFISYDLESTLPLRFEVHDVTGRVVASEDLGVLSAGEHLIELRASDYTAGIYYYSLISGAARTTKKMVVK